MDVYTLTMLYKVSEFFTLGSPPCTAITLVSSQKTLAKKTVDTTEIFYSLVPWILSWFWYKKVLFQGKILHLVFKFYCFQKRGFQNSFFFRLSKFLVIFSPPPSHFTPPYLIFPQIF